mmetsp:Transcript_56831/g.176245  ORF Transcript_56831/g.176245 Transcript_56831/m.176245 type:complete len:254 (-) Transcript_56831:714-1475(-)
MVLECSGRALCLLVDTTVDDVAAGGVGAHFAFHAQVARRFALFVGPLFRLPLAEVYHRDGLRRARASGEAAERAVAPELLHRNLGWADVRCGLRCLGTDLLRAGGARTPVLLRHRVPLRQPVLRPLRLGRHPWLGCCPAAAGRGLREGHESLETRGVRPRAGDRPHQCGQVRHLQAPGDSGVQALRRQRRDHLDHGAVAAYRRLPELLARAGPRDPRELGPGGSSRSGRLARGREALPQPPPLGSHRCRRRAA